MITIDELIEQINNTIATLKALTIKNNQNDDYKDNQLITKLHMLIKHLKEDQDMNMENFNRVLNETQKEADELIAKWS